MIKDPVCDNEVNMSGNRFKSVYKDNEYWFDSKECKEQFDSDPEAFVSRPSGEIKEKMREAGMRYKDESKEKARAIASEKKEGAAGYIENLSEALHGASQNLKDREMGDFAGYLDRLAVKTDNLSAYLRDSDTGKIARDAEDFIRKNPVLVLGGAVMAGFIFSRLIKSGKEKHGYKSAA